MAIYINRGYYHKNREDKKKEPRRTNNLLYIDMAVITEVKPRKKNLTMAWIDLSERL